MKERARLLRSTPTPAEAKLWYFLQRRSLGGLKFRRQHPTGPYILDFCCPRLKVGVEIDGDSHARTVSYDEKRTGWLEKQGYRLICFTNSDVLLNTEAALSEIARECGVELG
ncbi:MAG: endonuclease domain-containing protein [Chloroflexi bacterium]|nr:endonuclease domain-containing protein [Chloroflexota bacterium]